MPGRAASVLSCSTSKGTVVAEGSAPTPTRIPAAGQGEHDAEELWQAASPPCAVPSPAWTTRSGSARWRPAAWARPACCWTGRGARWARCSPGTMPGRRASCLDWKTGSGGRGCTGSAACALTRPSPVQAALAAAARAGHVRRGRALGLASAAGSPGGSAACRRPTTATRRARCCSTSRPGSGRGDPGSRGPGSRPAAGAQAVRQPAGDTPAGGRGRHGPPRRLRGRGRRARSSRAGSWRWAPTSRACCWTRWARPRRCCWSRPSPAARRPCSRPGSTRGRIQVDRPLTYLFGGLPTCAASSSGSAASGPGPTTRP